jgi:hypothetical protein
LKPIPYGVLRVSLTLDVITDRDESEDEAIAIIDHTYYIEDDKTSNADIIDAFNDARDTLSGLLVE